MQSEGVASRGDNLSTPTPIAPCTPDGACSDPLATLNSTLCTRCELTMGREEGEERGESEATEAEAGLRGEGPLTHSHPLASYMSLASLPDELLLLAFAGTGLSQRLTVLSRSDLRLVARAAAE